MVSLSEYIQFTEHAYCGTQGEQMAQMLSLLDEHIFNKNLWTPDIASSVPGKCIAPLDDLLVNHLLCVKAMHMQNYVEAFNYQIVLVRAIVKLLKTQTGTNWMLPVMFTACTDLRMVTQRAEIASEGYEKVLDQATDSLIECFKVCANDTCTQKDATKAIGLLNPVNHILRMHFKIHKYLLCDSIIQIVQPAVIDGPFPIAEQITFRFFVGRMALIHCDFRNANKHFFFAFKECHPQSYKNKRILLSYLVPVKMLLGYMPAKHLLEKYNLPMFWHLAVAVREGDIKAFENILERNQRFLISAGLFTVMDNLRIVAYRNVFKKVCDTMSDNAVPIAALQAGLQLMSQTPVDLAETQALVASMIFNHKIKAYMSYQQMTVVFHPHDPFPRLSTIEDPGFY